MASSTPPHTPRTPGSKPGYGPARPSDHSPSDPLRERRPPALPYGDQGLVTVGALTRVMSPNDLSETVAIVRSGANKNLLLGMQTQCQVCNISTADPPLCANCGKYGHPVCIGVEYFQGYAFCLGVHGGARFTATATPS